MHVCVDLDYYLTFSIVFLVMHWMMVFKQEPPLLQKRQQFWWIKTFFFFFPICEFMRKLSRLYSTVYLFIYFLLICFLDCIASYICSVCCLGDQGWNTDWAAWSETPQISAGVSDLCLPCPVLHSHTLAIGVRLQMFTLNKVGTALKCYRWHLLLQQWCLDLSKHHSVDPWY